MINRLADLFKPKKHLRDFEDSPVTFLIAGLGNPGREYRENRHNIGFMAIDRVGIETGIRLSRMQSKALVGAGSLGLQKIVLAKPQTFMNLSGQSVTALLRFYKLTPSQLLVIHDDLDLPLGTLRMRPSGGSAGQKGLASIIEYLGTQDFPRLRLGIGRPPGRMDAADYVLQDFPVAEQMVLKDVLDRAVKAARTFVDDGIERAMNIYNGAALDA
jgi:peptidyl-tRNA hydrolase, PTH1 family